MLNKIWKWLLILYVFVLPWQTRWIYEPRFLNGGFWEYGSASLFGSEILLWVIVIIFLIDFLRKKSFSHLLGKSHYETHKRNLWLAVGFILFLLISVLQSVNRAVSYDYFVKVLGGICLFIVVVSSGERKRLTLAFWAAAIVQAILGVYQFLSQAVFANKWLGLAAHKPAELGSFVVEFGDERWLRAYGAFGSPNILGGFLAVAFVLGIILYLYSSPAARIYIILGQAIILTGLVVSFSRGAFAATILGWVAVGGYIIYLGKNVKESFFKRYQLFWPYIKQSIFYAVIFAGLFTLLSPIFLVRFDSRYRLEAKSLADRKNQFEQSFKILNKNLLLGVGPGAYTYQLYKNEPTKKVYDFQPVHNIYLLVLCEWGILGFAIWATIFGFIIREIWRRRPEYLALIATILVAAAFDHFWWSLPGGMAVWWVIFGMILA